MQGTTRRSWLTRDEVYWSLALLVAGAVFSWGVGREPLWLDETYSFAMAQHELMEIWDFAKGDVHPPLYYWLLRGVVLTVGTTPEALRLISVVSGVGLIIVAYGPMRWLLGDGVSRWFAALTICTPGLVAFAQETRMYMLAIVLVTASALFGCLTLRSGKWVHAAGFALTTLAAWYTHYFAALVTAFCALLLMLSSLRNNAGRGEARPGEQHRPGTRTLMFTSALVVVGYLPWMGPALAQVERVSGGFWIPSPSPYLMLQTLAAPVAFKFEDLDLPWQAYLALGGLIALLGTALRARWAEGENSRKRGSVAWVLGGSVALTFAFAVGFSWLAQPILLPRYMIVTTGLQLTCAAIALNSLRRHARWLVAGAWFVSNGLTIGQILTGTFNGPTREIAAHIAAHDGPQLLVHGDLQTLYPAWYALPEATHMMMFAPDSEGWEPGAGVHASPRLVKGTGLDAALTGATSAWLLDATQFADRHFSKEDVAALPGWHLDGEVVEFAPTFSWVSVRLYRLVKDATTSVE